MSIDTDDRTDKRGVSAFLSFTGKAEAAMKFYAEALPGASIKRLVRYGKNHPFGGEETEFDVIFGNLSEGGTVMMGPESVGHIRKCAWVTDKFGVTWQPVWE